MDFRQLAAVITVADVGSVTKAARLLYVVQPAVTRQIRSLEDEIGVPLFERTRHGMVPTAAGALFIERARRALQELESARADIRPQPGVVTGVVTVGVLESVIEVLVQPLVDAVRARYPDVGLRILTAYSGHLQQWLDDGSLDFSLLYNLANTPSLAVIPLLEERLWAVGPPGSGLSPDVPLEWDTFLDHPLVLPVPGHGLRTLFDEGRAARSIEPRIVLETNSLYLQKKFVLAGHGWTVLPAVGVADDIATGVLSGAPLTAPDVARSIVLGHPRVAQMPPAAEAVATEIFRLIKMLVRSGAWPSARLIRDPGPAHVRAVGGEVAVSLVTACTFVA